MLTVLKVVCMATIGFIVSSLSTWQMLGVLMGTLVYAVVNYAEGFYAGYTKAADELVKVKSDV